MKKIFKKGLSFLTKNRKFDSLEKEFLLTVQKIKEENSKIVWSHYYVPKAIREILRKEKCIAPANNDKIVNLATSLMLRDLAEGTLNEFYRFQK